MRRVPVLPPVPPDREGVVSWVGRHLGHLACDEVRPSSVRGGQVAADAALAALLKRSVEEAPFICVSHDVGPRAMSTKVKGVVQPQSWFIDIATMSME